jgi:DNA mismatch endonuclease, patch repair protein
MRSELQRLLAPPASSPAARAAMQGNRSTDTRPEVRLRSELHRSGLRFRKNLAPPGLRCRIDVLFPKARLAVLVDGCFWHGCPEHGTTPRTNAAYWEEKLARNRARDRRNDAELAAAGWRVLRIWEHEPAAVAAVRVQEALAEAGVVSSGQ